MIKWDDKKVINASGVLQLPADLRKSFSRNSIVVCKAMAGTERGRFASVFIQQKAINIINSASPQ